MDSTWREASLLTQRVHVTLQHHLPNQTSQHPSNSRATTTTAITSTDQNCCFHVDGKIVYTLHELVRTGMYYVPSPDT